MCNIGRYLVNNTVDCMCKYGAAYSKRIKEHRYLLKSWSVCVCVCYNFFPHCTALGGLLGVVEGGVVVRMLSGMVVKVEVWVVVVWWLKKC